MPLRAPGWNRRPVAWTGRVKAALNRLLKALHLKQKLRISREEQSGPIPSWQNALARWWQEYIGKTDIKYAALLFVICAGAMVVFYPRGMEDIYSNLWVEFGGLTFDVLFILMIFALFERRRQRREDIERQKEIIEDYKRWDSEESHVRLAGALRRLNKLGIHAIDFSGASLSHFSFSENGINCLNGSSFYNGIWGDPLRPSRVHLEVVDFSWIDCKQVTFAPFEPLEGLGVRYVGHHAKFVDCTFQNTDLSGVSFNGALLQWSDPPSEEKYEYFESEDGQDQGRAQSHYGPFDGADLEGASFLKTKFVNADFQNAKNIDRADFKGARGLEDALFDTEEIRTRILAEANAEGQ